MTATSRLSRDDTRALLHRDPPTVLVADDFIDLLAVEAGTQPEPRQRGRLLGRIAAVTLVVGTTSVGATFAVEQLGVMHHQTPAPHSRAPGSGTGDAGAGSAGPSGSSSDGSGSPAWSGHNQRSGSGSQPGNGRQGQPDRQGTSASHRQDQTARQRHQPTDPGANANDPRPDIHHPQAPTATAERSDDSGQTSQPREHLGSAATTGARSGRVDPRLHTTKD
jgi:hypothetical protein